MNVISALSPQTHDLRRRILRANDPDADVRWPGDDAENTIHLAVVDGDENVVGVSTWITSESATQLRGMATDPNMAGQGVGTLLLDAGVGHARSNGSSHIWANARVTAVGFYTRYGFVMSGPVFDTEATGLPHRLATFDLA